MSKMYLFSYNTVVRTPVVVRRKWWNLFGKDKVEFVEHSTRKHVISVEVSVVSADVSSQPTPVNWLQAVPVSSVFSVVGSPQATSASEATKVAAVRVEGPRSSASREVEFSVVRAMTISSEKRGPKGLRCARGLLTTTA